MKSEYRIPKSEIEAMLGKASRGLIENSEEPLSEWFADQIHEADEHRGGKEPKKNGPHKDPPVFTSRGPSALAGQQIKSLPFFIFSEYPHDSVARNKTMRW